MTVTHQSILHLNEAIRHLESIDDHLTIAKRELDNAYYYLGRTSTIHTIVERLQTIRLEVNINSKAIYDLMEGYSDIVQDKE